MSRSETTPGADEGPRRRPLLALLPLVAFSALAAVFGVVLARGGNDGEVRSVLIGTPAPPFVAPALDGLGVPGFSADDLKGGGVTVVNVWGSWCGPCRLEHPVLVELARDPSFRLIGLDHKDQDGAARDFLAELGNPFDAVGTDRSGRIGIDWGVYGVPETFIVDNDGIIRAKLIAPLTPSRIRSELMPAIEAARTPLPAPATLPAAPPA